MSEHNPLDELIDITQDYSHLPNAATIYPLLGDRGNQRVLRDWIEGHDSYDAVDPELSIRDAEFDLCIVDEPALETHAETLKDIKHTVEPVLLPVLLLLPERRTEVIDIDDGAIAENVFATTIDEIVSLPIRQAELQWRIRALLRLRKQSLDLTLRTNRLDLFRQAVEDSGHAVYITDPDATIVYVNPAFEEITGYSRSEAVGQTPRLLHSGEMPDEYFEELWATVLDGKVWSAELIDRRKDGELYHAAQTIAPVTEDGDITAFVAVQTDISQRKERETTLERRTQAIESAPIGVCITDPNQPDNPLVYVNEAFEDVTGYSREESIGRNCRFLQGPLTDDQRVAEIRDAIEAEEPISTDIRNYRKDGTEFWNQLNIAPVRDDDGDLISFVGFQQDVTDRRQREQQLEVLGRILRHNLRNDMTVVQGQAEVIAENASGIAADAAEAILDKSEQLLNLTEKERVITDILTTQEQLDTDIPTAVRQIAQTVRAEFDAATVTVDTPETAVARALPQFERAISELVTNAIVHNDATEPEVTITVSNDPEHVTIAIRDTGPEIPENERSLLLGGGEQTPTQHGRGIGLWLVNLVVMKSGGTIEYESDDGGGNIVRVTLPT
jgi:PAS domain S-box-containing protein